MSKLRQNIGEVSDLKKARGFKHSPPEFSVIQGPKMSKFMKEGNTSKISTNYTLRQPFKSELTSKPVERSIGFGDTLRLSNLNPTARNPLYES
jgi:hypothetical protein